MSVSIGVPQFTIFRRVTVITDVLITISVISALRVSTKNGIFTLILPTAPVMYAVISER